MSLHEKQVATLYWQWMGEREIERERERERERGREGRGTQRYSDNKISILNLISFLIYINKWPQISKEKITRHWADKRNLLLDLHRKMASDRLFHSQTRPVLVNKIKNKKRLTNQKVVCRPDGSNVHNMKRKRFGYETQNVLSSFSVGLVWTCFAAGKEMDDQY